MPKAANLCLNVGSSGENLLGIMANNLDDQSFLGQFIQGSAGEGNTNLETLRYH